MASPAMSSKMNAVDLLRIEMGILWGEDFYGRLRRRPHVVILATSAGSEAHVGEGPSPDLSQRLREIISSESPGLDPSRPPAGLDRCRELLGGLGSVEQHAGPSYLIPAGVRYPGASTIVRSDWPHPEGLRESRPARWWEPDEWDDLLQGKLGPWAIMLEGREIIAVCHTPRASARGAEAGVWTHPDHRGRGHASAVTAAWASTPIGENRMLFYSTSAENASSRRVAERLALRPIGWIWTLRLR